MGPSSAVGRRDKVEKPLVYLVSGWLTSLLLPRRWEGRQRRADRPWLGAEKLGVQGGWLDAWRRKFTSELYTYLLPRSRLL